MKVAIDMLSALKHLQQNDVVHRDIKKDNIMIAPLKNGDFITVLIDF